MYEDELRREYADITEEERRHELYMREKRRKEMSPPLEARHQHGHDHLMEVAASGPTNLALHLNELWEHMEQHHRDHEFSDMYNRDLWDLWASHNAHHYAIGHDTLGEVDARR